MPADASQVDQVDLSPPGKILGGIDSNPGIGLLQIFERNRLPPDFQIRNIQPNHQVPCEDLVVMVLQNKFHIAVAEPRATIAFPEFFKT